PLARKRDQERCQRHPSRRSRLSRARRPLRDRGGSARISTGRRESRAGGAQVRADSGCQGAARRLGAVTPEYIAGRFPLEILRPMRVFDGPLPIDSGSTAWMLTSSALVLFMVPGLAMFYAGMVRRKNIIATMMYSFGAMAVIGVQWVVVGYGLAFGTDHAGLIGWDPGLVMLHSVRPGDLYADKAIPALAFIMFQGKFAIITPALISGAVAERMRFSTFLVFSLLWATFIYCPLAHWVWA